MGPFYDDEAAAILWAAALCSGMVHFTPEEVAAMDCADDQGAGGEG